MSERCAGQIVLRITNLHLATYHHRMQIRVQCVISEKEVMAKRHKAKLMTNTVTKGGKQPASNDALL